MRTVNRFSLAFLIVLQASCANSATSPSWPAAPPTVSSISPTSGQVGSQVVVTGSNFAATGNIVKFGIGYVGNLSSSDGTTLRFAVPDTLSPCVPNSPNPCAQVLVKVTPGDYVVSVMTGDATSNTKTFTVKAQ